MEKLSPQDSVFNTVVDQYNKVVNNFSSSLIRKNLTEEFKTKGDYVGREIYELLQNAEDQKSEYVKITLDENCISVENGGPECVPFSKDGFISIMMADMSPKFGNGEKQYIGCKGLGFRSILNWAKSIEISSNGVSCKFSREIADACWEGIKQHIIHNVGDKEKAIRVIEEHESFAQKNYGFNTPVPTLAKPKTREYPEANNSTIITVEYDKGDTRVVNSIKEQIESLSGAVLIFLTNIKKIIIQDNIHNTTQVLTSTYKQYDEEILLYTISAQNQQTSFFVLKKSGDVFNKKYGVSIAYCPELKDTRHYLYSFFPTKMYIGLPCLIHATFDLNSSRNAIKENSPENDKLMEILAGVLMHFSCWIAKHQASNDIYGWDAYSILSLNEYDRQDFPILDCCIKEQLPRLPIIPTIGRKYLPITEIEYYGNDFSVLFEDVYSDLPLCGKLFGKHIKSCIPSSLKVPLSSDFDRFKQRIDTLSEGLLDIGNRELDMRIKLIDALLQLDCGQKFKVLLERDLHRLCQDTAYIYVGHSLPNPPAELKNTYIDKDLLSLLYNHFGSQDPDTIRKKLANVTDIRRSDVNTLKERIISFSEKNTDTEKFKELIRSFFIGIFKVNKESDNISSVVEEISNRLFFFDSTGSNKHYPCEMVLKEKQDNLFNEYKPEWILYLSLEEWAQYLDTDIDTARDFFTHSLGVSSLVPKEYVSFGEDSQYLTMCSAQYPTNEPPWPYCFQSDQILNYQSDRKAANFGYIVKPEFLDFLAAKCKTCNEFLNIIFGDSICKYAVTNKFIYYQYRSLHSEIASCSYLEYKLREHPFLRPIKTYIISEKLNLLSEEKYTFELLPACSEQETKQILLNLGAKESITSLSKKDLYSILLKIPEVYGDKPRGVSLIYRKIREALLKYRDECEEEAHFFRENGKVYARIHGEIILCPTSKVYYWDNDQLPQKVLTTKPKFEIGNRIGEESIKDLFGISLAKEISISDIAEESILNETLTNQINDYFRRRIKYILSYCYKGQNRFKEDYVEPLKDIQFRIYTNYKYNMDGSDYVLDDGEMVTRPGRDHVYNICSHIGTIYNDSIDDPQLCEALVESLCITLKITGSELVGCFRNIISNAISKNEFLWRKDIDADVWAAIEKTMGLSEKEKKYWAIIAEQTMVRDFDLSRLSLGYREKINYLSVLYPNIEFGALFSNSFPEFDEMNLYEKYALAIGLKQYGFENISIFGENGLYDYYAKRLHEIKNTYGDAYKTLKYRSLKGQRSRTVDDVYAFYESCHQFLNRQSWTDEQAEEYCKVLLEESALENIIKDYLLKQFGIKDRNDVEDIVPLESYSSIMDKAGVIESDFEQKDLALRYFEGFEDIFSEKAEAITQQRNTDNSSANSEDGRNIIGKLSYGVGVPIEPGQKSKHFETSGGSYNSRPAILYRNGKNAEWLVYNTIYANPQIYPKVIKNSRILDPLIGSDNNDKHCDILYYKADKPAEERYLEVKSLKGSSIYLSDEEYLFAIEHKDTYDIAVVKDNSVTIIEHPFQDEDKTPMLRARPDVYRIDLKVDRKHS